MIYLDNAASTPLLPSVKEKLLKVLDVYGNPSSIHKQGRIAKELINNSKNIIANKLNCNEDELFFTSGASMSNSVILTGFNNKIISSAIEHEDIQMICLDSEKIFVDKNGIVNIENLKEILEKVTSPTLFSIQMANGEIGTIQEISKISKLIHGNPNCYLHTDATQYIPYYPIDVKKMEIDALSMSGQKIGCIKGIGLAYISKKLQKHISPVIYGKQGLIGGTENVPGIVCLGEAFKNLNYDNEEMFILRNRLIDRLNGTLIGDSEYRLPNNVCMYFESVPAETLVVLLDEYGICCSAGSACSNNDNEPSSTLLALGLNEEQVNSCVRFTLGRETTKDEIDKAIEIINNVVNILRELY